MKIPLEELLPTAGDDQQPACGDGKSTHKGKLEKLEAFAIVRSLAKLQPALTIYQAGAHEDVATLDCLLRSDAWHMIQRTLQPSRLTLIASPRLLSYLCEREVYFEDAQAFQIPLQRVDLSFEDMGVTVCGKLMIDFKLVGINSDIVLAGDMNLSESTACSPFTLRPWTSLHYHGGTHRPVYKEFQYFAKRPPCLLASNSASIPSGFNDLMLGANLTNLAYTAIFPHLMHINALARAIVGCTCLKDLRQPHYCSSPSTSPLPRSSGGCPNLRVLDIRLGPTRAANNGEEPSEQVDDNSHGCWHEMEQCYGTLISLCRWTEDVTSVCESSGTISIADVSSNAGWESSALKQEDLVEVHELERLDSPPTPMTNALGAALPKLERFISRDVEDGILVQKVRQIFRQTAPVWLEDKRPQSGCWSRAGDQETTTTQGGV